MVESIHLDHAMNYQLRGGIKAVSIVSDFLKDSIWDITELFHLMVSLGFKPSMVHVKPNFIPWSESNRFTMSIMMRFIMILGFLESFKNLGMFAGQGLQKGEGNDLFLLLMWGA